MKVVSIGDLVLDYYYKDGKLLGVNGGMTSHNIVANLSHMKIPTSVYGVCGNDAAGLLAMQSLKDLDVDTTNIKILDNISTRCFHVSYINNNNKIEFTSKKRCPLCNIKNWYNDSLINPHEIINNLNKEDILVFDNLNNKNQYIIDNTKNKKLLDLGQYFELENITNEEIINKIKNKFTIINFNERVINYLKVRFNIKSISKLYSILTPKLMIITKGRKGVEFIYNNKSYSYKLSNISKEVDPTGAGDSFFASIIKDWIKNNEEFNESIFSTWYENSTKLASKVVTKMGARGHLNKLYKIKNITSCTCKDFNLVVRKKVKCCNININNLEKRVINATRSKAIDNIYNINFNTNESYIFTGTGGSYTASIFSSLVINALYGSNVYALLPRDILFRNNNLINKVILFSYSGTTNDLHEGTKCFDTKNKYIITKGDTKDIVAKTNIPNKNIISYRTNVNKSKERGFLSLEGTLSPASIFLMYYLKETNSNINVEEFIKKSIKKWDTYFSNKFKLDNIKNMFNKENVVNIFTGDNTLSASYDIESKFIESGIVNVIIHEKKNFSHGRFINYENLNNKNNIYLKSNITSSYEKELLTYLSTGNNLIIESEYDKILCEYDLLIAAQFLIYHIGKTKDIDVSKPEYSSNAMKLYFYKGNL